MCSLASVSASVWAIPLCFSKLICDHLLKFISDTKSKFEKRTRNIQFFLRWTVKKMTTIRRLCHYNSVFQDGTTITTTTSTNINQRVKKTNEMWVKNKVVAQKLKTKTNEEGRKEGKRKQILWTFCQMATTTIISLLMNSWMSASECMLYYSGAYCYWCLSNVSYVA